MIKVDFKNLSDQTKQLFDKSLQVRENAYCPYSNFKVGAALIDSNGQIHTGCNIESADYTLTSHAEMVAIDSMVKSGVVYVRELLISMMSGDEIPVPCGLCRQKISEFVDSDIDVFAVNLSSDKSIKEIYNFKFSELYPFSFNSKSFK